MKSIPEVEKLYLQLLGPPQIFWQERPLTISRRQARAALYRLAADLQPVSREQLAFLFWSDVPEAAAKRNLNRLLSYLRQALPRPDCLLVTRSSVQVNQNAVSTDCHFLTLPASAAEDEPAARAIDHYQGSFLAGFSLPDAAEFENWRSQTAVRLEQRYLDILQQLLKQKQAAGDLSAAIEYGRRYLVVDELAEEVHRQLITLYGQTDERAAVSRQFEQCSLILERELGVSPLPETRAAYEAARDGSQPTRLLGKPEPVWATISSLDLPLFGRETEWEALSRAYGRLHTGGVLFISGEPGMGKSRLMQEFATSRPGLVLSGNNQAGGSGFPYQPLIQALRQALPLRTYWENIMPIWLAELSRLMPELHDHYPDLPSAVDVEPQQAQARLFEAFRQAFISLAGRSSLLLCLDDVHWLDESSLGWLQYITRQLNNSNLCIVATYRTHQAEALGEWQRALRRANLMELISLAGLPETAVADLLLHINDEMTAPEPLAGHLHKATAGNTFFILETIRELQATNQLLAQPSALPLPPTVRETVLRRADRLNPLARQILEVTAVLSHGSNFFVISQTAGRDDLETAESLEELVKHQLILTENDHFRIQHDLAREAIYHQLSPWRRRLLHQRAAKTLAAMDSDGRGVLAIVADHFEAAGDILQTIDYLHQAAAAAQSVFAYQEAIHYLKRAIALAEKTTEVTTVLPQLQETLADNLTITGSFPAAAESIRLALAQTPDSDILRLADLERKLAETLPPQHRSDEAEAIYRNALARLENPTTTANSRSWQSTRLNILLGLLDTLYLQNSPKMMSTFEVQTQALLRSVGTPEQKITFYNRMDQMSLLQSRFCPTAELTANVQKRLALVQATNNPRLIARQEFSVGFHQLWYGNFDRAESRLQTAKTIAKELGETYLQNQCLAYLNILFRMRCDIERVTAQLPRLLEISEWVGYRNYIGVAQANRAWLLYRTDEWPQALTYAQSALDSWRDSSYPFQWLANWLLLAIAVQQNRLPEAISATQALLDPNQQCLQDEVEKALLTAVQSWQKGNIDSTQKGLTLAVTLASNNRYL